MIAPKSIDSEHVLFWAFLPLKSSPFEVIVELLLANIVVEDSNLRKGKKFDLLTKL